MRERRQEGFDLAAECPSRFTLVATAPDEHHFVWTFHHIVMDAWSVSAVFDEVFAVYEALRDGRTATLPAPVSYRDYIAWLAARDRSADEEFWRARLDGFTGPTTLRSPTATARAASGRSRSSCRRTCRRRAEPRRTGAAPPPNTVLHAAWALLAGRYTGARDVAVRRDRDRAHRRRPGHRAHGRPADQHAADAGRDPAGADGERVPARPPGRPARTPRARALARSPTYGASRACPPGPRSSTRSSATRTSPATAARSPASSASRSARCSSRPTARS